MIARPSKKSMRNHYVRSKNEYTINFGNLKLLNLIGRTKDQLNKISSNDFSFRLQNIIFFIVIGFLSVGLIHEIYNIAKISYMHTSQPNIFGDSFTFVQREEKDGLFSWLIEQHN